MHLIMLQFMYAWRYVIHLDKYILGSNKISTLSCSYSIETGTANTQES